MVLERPPPPGRAPPDERQRQDRVDQADPQQEVVGAPVVELGHILEVHAEEARDELERQEDGRHRREDVDRFFLTCVEIKILRGVSVATHPTHWLISTQLPTPLEVELRLLRQTLDVTQRGRDVVLELGDVLARIFYIGVISMVDDVVRSSRWATATSGIFFNT